MLSYSTLVSGSSDGGSLIIKLSVIVSYTLFGVGSDYRSPYSLCRDDFDFA